MCGRYTLISIKTLHDRFDITGEPMLFPRYNIAPSQDIAAIRSDGAERYLDLLHWGLIPSWAKDPAIGNRMINARSEDIDKNPAFRKAFELRRCLIPADGFYEWKKSGKTKQPWYFTMKDGKPFAFAGVWERWKNPETKQTVESATILTTSPNELAAEVHDRMPVIISPEDYSDWLDEKSPKDRLQEIMKPYPAMEMTDYPVSSRVNSPKNEDTDCVEETSPKKPLKKDSEPTLF